ncbi:MAG: hydroxymethylglutaryl-CoA synthase [Thermoplasmata archaeon]|jgi:hydroxymethylglutaryl-CoA synthase|nr:hydroxymethylglutaryl-CoA synthase [Thermoplasmata archaeon]
MPVGIISYGAYVPRHRIKSEEIARVWGDDQNVGRSLNVLEKSVPAIDEDVATMSVEAARQCMARAPSAVADIGAIYVGSESHPYAVKPTGTIVQAALDAGPYLTMADYEFACKAGTAAVQTAMGLVQSNMCKTVLAVGADTSQGAPRNALEYSASAGAAALLVGNDKRQVLAEIDHTVSFTTDTPDFWRREGQKYPSHGERFTGEPAYFRHVRMASERLFADTGTFAKDYTWAVFHQPNGKFPATIAQKLGFTQDQYAAGLLAPRIGNTYSAAVLLGLCNILDQAKPGDSIFMCGYGSGAGADAFKLTVTKNIEGYDRAKTLEAQLARTNDLDYATYAKNRGKLIMGGMD